MLGLMDTLTLSVHSKPSSHISTSSHHKPSTGWGFRRPCTSIQFPLHILCQLRETTFRKLHTRLVLRPRAASTDVQNYEGYDAYSENNDEEDESFMKRELDEFPEEWRRIKIAWLCKELPRKDLVPVRGFLSNQKRWLQQDDVIYVVCHFLRLRENILAYRVYKWLTEQNWFNFNYVFATKLADYLAKDLKVKGCRDILDDIITRGRVPAESTFSLLIMAYIKLPDKGYIDEACTVYNLMIHFAKYQPGTYLETNLFRALLRETGGVAKRYVNQAEILFQNMKKAGHNVKQDIYEGLVWLHSYQNSINRERIDCLIEEMKQKGYNESYNLQVSMLRVCAAYGDIDEAEKIWLRICKTSSVFHSHPYVYRMEVYAKAGLPKKSLEIFMSMKERGIPDSVIAYHKIIKIMSDFQEIEHAENLMKSYEESSLKSLQPAYVNIMRMYMSLSMFDKVESKYFQCKSKCRLNRDAYDIYIKSLIMSDKLGEAEKIFEGLRNNDVKGGVRTYNIMLEGFLQNEEIEKAKLLYDEMLSKRHAVHPILIDSVKEKLIVNGEKHNLNSPPRLMLSAKQREILVGLLLSGARLDIHDENNSYAVHFEIDESLEMHDSLKMHLLEEFYDWLNPIDRLRLKAHETPLFFSTRYHTSFCFYASRFRPEGKMRIPELVHRWLSPCVLAYWYMYGGRKSKSGDMVLLTKNNSYEEIQLVANALSKKAISCQVKRRGNLFQLRFTGKGALLFWKLIEMHIPEDLKEALNPVDLVPETSCV